MAQSIRMAWGFVLGTIAVLGAMTGPARARPGTAPNSSSPTSARAVRPPSTGGLGTRRDDLAGAEDAVDVPGRCELGHDRRRTIVESRIRRLVAEQLGVDAQELVPEVSLTDELAADSLDLAELVVIMESEFSIGMSQQRINAVRTYGDLVDAVATCLDGQGRRRVRLIPPALPARSCIAAPASEGGGSLERAEPLTPYALQLIQDDASCARRGTRLEITLPAGATVDDVAAIENELARLGRRGIEVSVRRDVAWGAETIAEVQLGRPAGETG